MSEEPEVVVVRADRLRRKPVGITGPVAFPDWSVSLDGVDLADRINPRLISLSISERRGAEADQLDIVLNAADGELELPKTGAVLAVALGWKGGGGTTPGLVQKGLFTVDEVEHAGPPDRITVRARSADFTAALRQVRDKSWRSKSLGVILKEIADRHKLALRIAPALEAKTPKLVTQNRESDIALIARLGKEYDAVATIKAKTLIFLPMGGGQSASGQSLAKITIARGDGDRHSYRIEARQDYTGVTAKWYNRATAKEVEIVVGTKANAKALRKRYATAAEATRAANTAWSAIKRAPRKLTLDLALGRPDIMPESPVTITGFASEIADQDWIVAEVTHRLDGNGITSSLSLEVRGTGED
jgi:uncharacterized protein